MEKKISFPSLRQVSVPFQPKLTFITMTKSITWMLLVHSLAASSRAARMESDDAGNLVASVPEGNKVRLNTAPRVYSSWTEVLFPFFFKTAFVLPVFPCTRGNLATSFLCNELVRISRFCYHESSLFQPTLFIKKKIKYQYF